MGAVHYTGQHTCASSPEFANPFISPSGGAGTGSALRSREANGAAAHPSLADEPQIRSWRMDRPVLSGAGRLSEASLRGLLSLCLICWGLKASAMSRTETGFQGS